MVALRRRPSPRPRDSRDSLVDARTRLAVKREALGPFLIELRDLFEEVRRLEVAVASLDAIDMAQDDLERKAVLADASSAAARERAAQAHRHADALVVPRDRAAEIEEEIAAKQALLAPAAEEYEGAVFAGLPEARIHELHDRREALGRALTQLEAEQRDLLEAGHEMAELVAAAVREDAAADAYTAEGQRLRNAKEKIPAVVRRLAVERYERREDARAGLDAPIAKPTVEPPRVFVADHHGIVHDLMSGAIYTPDGVPIKPVARTASR